MPKARANINVYSSTPSSDFILEDEMRCSLYQELHGMWNEIGQASLFRAKERPIHATTELKHTEREPSIAITADLRPFVTHAGLIVNTAVLTRHP